MGPAMTSSERWRETLTCSPDRTGRVCHPDTRHEVLMWQGVGVVNPGTRWTDMEAQDGNGLG